MTVTQALEGLDLIERARQAHREKVRIDRKREEAYLESRKNDAAHVFLADMQRVLGITLEQKDICLTQVDGSWIGSVYLNGFTFRRQYSPADEYYVLHATRVCGCGEDVEACPIYTLEEFGRLLEAGFFEATLCPACRNHTQASS